MRRLDSGLALVALATAALAVPAWAQAPSARRAKARGRLTVVANAAFQPTGPGFSDSQAFPEYAEETTLRTSYDAGSAFGPDLAVQVRLFGSLGVLVGYSQSSRDVGATVNVSRPHPLYLDRPRSATAETSGYDLSERAVHLDLAFARTAGHLDWALFAGASLFHVEGDLLGKPTYTEVYPYDELVVATTPSVTAKESPTGFNVGGRLDYRFGSSRRLGAGVQVLYSTASVALRAAAEATEATFDAGGLSMGAGMRLYF